MPSSMRMVLRGLLDRMDLEDLVETCDDLMWRLRDNGSELLDVCRDRSESGDPKEVEAALFVNGGFLWRDRHEMERRLGAVAERWPRFADRVTEILRSWGIVSRARRSRP